MTNKQLTNNDYTWYPPLAMRTCKDMPTLKDHLAHMAMGLGSEYLKYRCALSEENANEETGDLMWFLSGICSSLNIPFIAKETTQWDVDEILGDIISICKKHFAYSVEIDIPKLTNLCQKLIYIINTDNKLEEILNKNLNKLKLRYPEYYTDQLAV